MTKLKPFLRRFRDDEDGSMAIELLLVTPILVWVFLSTFVYFDAFRVETNSVRATITLAEMFSREDVIDVSFLNGARSALRALTFEERNPDYRVTVYRYRASDDTFRRVWGKNRGMGGDLTNADLAALKAKGRLPPMNEIDHNVFIETRTQYSAPFNIGLGPFVATNLQNLTFTSDMIIRPRAGRLCWDPDVNVANNEVCGPS